ncbi:hypothetical protein PFICI_10648 [Pestalotiopsis fici W106-1]|uniref:BZIP domain-containing protein n=1 Tax=Pestalotiopsis fici (strain W106-1 / CGMCC3.15140) TaxID=1229662 RepID=W3X0B5_PESFW|nr:uncharacterized protein PFICI_10648 [Pestalotiopsis fici W106-1]ETS78586.1 hypothetical protein PFICI_10648 [Pestalotiopsis fici W106-1]
MRVMQSDLAILNAAQYEDGLSSSRGGHGPAVPMKAIPSVREEAPSRKRPRAASTAQASQADHEEDKKRARGRPRLDPKDQTPQDRRRTQIRNAQRAYRDRKESAISTLEKEVDGLKEANEQMSSAYRKLFDLATRKGLLDGAPELSQQLMQLDALAKTAGMNSPKSEEEAESSDSARGRKSSNPSSVADAHTESHQQMQPQQHNPMQQLMGGIMVTHEPSTLPSQMHSHPMPGAPFHGMSMGYEIIAQPTSQNASFPQTLSYDQSTLFNTNWMQAPAAWNTLSSPASYAPQEPQFSRRLQRTALQRAAKLISMKDPPPERLTRVFGFSRLFETYEQIRDRLMACLDRTETEDLSYTGYPLQTVGGAGTHFPEMHAGGPGNGLNPKTFPEARPGRPASRAPFSVGPFERHTEMIRRSLTSLADSMLFPGFDGVFWDPDEVDFYLKSNGVHIPARADYHVVEILDDAFAGPPPSLISQTETLSPSAVPSSNSSSNASIGQQMPSTLQTPSTSATSRSHSSTDGSNDNATIPMNVPLDMWQSHISSQVDADEQFSNAYTHVPPTNMANFASNMPSAFGDPSLLGSVPGHHHQHLLGMPVSHFDGLPTFIQPPAPRKQRWNINVEKFIDELIARTMCLGRTPGFRPRDVDVAFWASVVVPGSS